MRYKFRQEFFGGIVYDTENKGYLFFDKLVSFLIQNYNFIEQNDSDAKSKLAIEHGSSVREIDDLIDELNVWD
ncbi:MAG: hypothetical protein K6U80_19210 [Firmicutes bacterium]|nr:hypothetical protein [Bacillota bacterium]